MASAALQAFRRTVTVAWPKQANEDARKLLIATARAGNEKIVAAQTSRAGVPPGVDAYANSPGNKNLESVKVPGPIVYRYDYRREIAVVALAELRRASPIISGLYRDSHLLFIGGIPVESAPPIIGPNTEIFIANPVAYARRLEVGVTESGRPFVLQVPPHIYERVIGILRSRYRNVAKLSMDYVLVPGSYIIKGRLPARYWTTGSMGRPVYRKRRQEVGKPVRSPAIVIGRL